MNTKESTLWSSGNPLELVIQGLTNTYNNKVSKEEKCGGEFPLQIGEISLGSRPLFDPRQRKINGKLLPLKPIYKQKKEIKWNKEFFFYSFLYNVPS